MGSVPIQVGCSYGYRFRIRQTFRTTSVPSTKVSAIKVLATEKKSRLQGFCQQFIPGWSCDATRLYQEFKSAKNEQQVFDKSRDLIHLSQTRQERWKETGSKLNLIHSSCKTWQAMKRVRRESSLGTADSIASQLVANGSAPNGDKVFSCAVKTMVAER